MTAVSEVPSRLVADFAVERADFAVSIQFTAQAGRVVAIVGPNGSGKSTLLRTIAGLEPSAQGRLRVNTADWMTDEHFLAPEERSIGFVFQDYLLFPHLSVFDNISFGMHGMGLSKVTVRERVFEWMHRYEIADLADRKPGQISGGQAQRVALTRALIRQPDVLLMDEPLAALDAGTRAGIRAQLRSHLSEFAGTALLVTHDPLEALVLGDDICVLDRGRIMQFGTAAQVTRQPATPYVARLMGLNLVAGQAGRGVVDLDGGGQLRIEQPHPLGRVMAVIRPSAITVHQDRPHGSARNVWVGAIRGIEQVAERVRLDIAATPSVLVDVTAAAVAELDLTPGSPVWLSVKATEIDVYAGPVGTEFT